MADARPNAYSTEPAADWWGEAFPLVPYEKNPPGEHQMLTVVAYDISDQKRLAKVAKICEDFGVRVQYSIFECYLDQESFNDLWLKLLEVVDEGEDRLVAYKLDARCAKETETAGTMVCSEKALCYLV
ncbi:CRISPR-associated endoribonuclease Cas2 [Verrucomicrobia bacterium]|nr:CRISPR-associated endoribonuclease Cas2 [Verrucomicrobiota bacterium]